MTRKKIGRRVLAQATEFANRCQRWSTVRPQHHRRDSMKEKAITAGVYSLQGRSFQPVALIRSNKTLSPSRIPAATNAIAYSGFAMRYRTLTSPAEEFGHGDVPINSVRRSLPSAERFWLGRGVSHHIDLLFPAW